MIIGGGIMDFQFGMSVYSGPLCKALSLLKQEHGPLRKQMVI